MITNRSLLRTLERREQAWATERAELIATICRLAGKGLPATPSEQRPADATPATDRWTTSPEQLPV